MALSRRLRVVRIANEPAARAGWSMGRCINSLVSGQVKVSLAALPLIAALQFFSVVGARAGAAEAATVAYIVGLARPRVVTGVVAGAVEAWLEGGEIANKGSIVGLLLRTRTSLMYPSKCLLTT